MIDSQLLLKCMALYYKIKQNLKIRNLDFIKCSKLCTLACSFFFVLQVSAQTQPVLGKFDGPYFFYDNGVAKLVRVEGGEIVTETNPANIFSITTDDGRHHFNVSRHVFKIPNWKYPNTHKLLVISDPHGDFESFFSILKAQEVIGENYEWTYGKNRLMIIGDVFDRGKDVLPIFWLIYKLEYEAEKVGGKVHFLFGNHEQMVLQGDYRYAQDKYKALANSIGKDYRDFWSLDTELGKWLQSKNTMEKIGDNLFVHAGLSRAMLDPKWTIPAVNDSVRFYLFQNKEERKRSTAASFLFGSEGPLWYRGMVRQEDKYQPLSEVDLEKLLQIYGSKRVYLGHTIFPEVTSFYNGQVSAVNVSNEKNRLGGKSRGLLLEGNKTIVIYDDAKKNKILEK